MIIIFCVAFCVLSEFGCYKFIKYYDKKERAKLQRWENRYVDSRREETDKYLEMQRLKLEEKKKREEQIEKEKAKQEKKEKKKK